ncbi:MAG: hypothetical protein AAGM22_20565 [Acidobacteriota bacterium]
MTTDRERTPPPQPRRTPAQDELFARIAEAFEADGASVERVKLRARQVARPERDPHRRPRAMAARVAAATALTLLLAVGLWRFSPRTTPVDLDPAAETSAAVTEAEGDATDDRPRLVISNASGFVTVQAGGSQWIVLPGDTQ